MMSFSHLPVIFLLFGSVHVTFSFRPTTISSLSLRRQGQSTTSLDATIAVIGASGLLASECVYQCLKAGDNVIGLTRNPQNVVVPNGSGGDDKGKPMDVAGGSLKLIGGDVTNKDTVDRLFSENNIDGCIISLGGKTKEVGDTMLQVGTANVVNAMKSNNVKRLAVVSSIGVGDSENQAPFFFKILMKTAMKKIFADKNAQEAVVKTSDLEYCIVRPGGLTVDPPTGVVNVIDGEAGSISRADVAEFCIAVVKQPSFEYIGKTPCISSVGGTSWVKDRSGKARGME